jgi:hypothetical protein
MVGAAALDSKPSPNLATRINGGPLSGWHASVRLLVVAQVSPKGGIPGSSEKILLNNLTKLIF